MRTHRFAALIGAITLGVLIITSGAHAQAWISGSTIGDLVTNAATNRVGILTSTPGAALDVNGNVSVSSTITASSSITAGTDVVAGNNMWATGSINAGGNVTTTGTVFATDIMVSHAHSFGDISADNDLSSHHDITAVGNIFAGNDLIATGSLLAGLDLTVSRNAAVSLNATIGNDLIVVNDAVVRGGITVSNASTFGSDLTIGQDAFINRDLYVSGNGQVSGNMLAAAYFTSSDARLKENIVPVQNVLEKLGSIQPVYFNYNTVQPRPAGRQLGFLAQEVQKEFPELVSTTSTGYLAVAYGNMAAVAIEAIKEQQQSIQDLQAKITRLEQIVQQLTGCCPEPAKTDLR